MVLKHPDAGKWLDAVQIDAGAEALLYRDGVLTDRLGQGLHVYRKGAGKVTWKTVDLREQIADVARQEIMTADKVSLRVNLLVTYQVTDSVKAVTAVADPAQALYREAQLTLRAAVGTRTLDALLADKESVGGGFHVAVEGIACGPGAFLHALIQAIEEAEGRGDATDEGISLCGGDFGRIHTGSVRHGRRARRGGGC